MGRMTENLTRSMRCRSAYRGAACEGGYGHRADHYGLNPITRRLVWWRNESRAR